MKRISMDKELTAQEKTARFLTSIGYVAVPVRQNVAGQLLINAKINDVDGVYILDSGAGQTVVDARRSGMLKLDLNRDEAALTGGGLGVHSIETVPSYNNKLDINGFKIGNLVVAVMPLESAWESLAVVGAHDELLGFIGVDILKAGNAIVDFSTMTLYLMHQPLATM